MAASADENVRKKAALQRPHARALLPPLKVDPPPLAPAPEAVERTLLVFEEPIDLEPLGALDEGDARFQASLGGPSRGHPSAGDAAGLVEGVLLEEGVAATLRLGGAATTLLLGPFHPIPGNPPMLELRGNRTSALHTCVLPGARLRVSLRSVVDSPGRRRFLGRRLWNPRLRGRQCGPRRDDAEPRAVVADPEAPAVLLVLLIPEESRLLLAQARLEPTPV